MRTCGRGGKAESNYENPFVKTSTADFIFPCWIFGRRTREWPTTFATPKQALDYVRKQNLKDVQLVVKFDDAQWDEIIPLPLLVASLSATIRLEVRRSRAGQTSQRAGQHVCQALKQSLFGVSGAGVGVGRGIIVGDSGAAIGSGFPFSALPSFQPSVARDLSKVIQMSIAGTR